jgi:tetratricopeptide (TPR) repeat protein
MSGPDQARKIQVKPILVIGVVLGVVTFAVYWRGLENGFIQFYDDVQYVTGNPHVQSGLTPENIAWAFTTAHSANWHPLTWLSHMLDCQLFGMNAWGHHLTNILFHIANAILLFLVLHRMTTALWQSAFVAAVFALHPLHVESVAWVAERKDVLSTFFWILTMWAYLRYSEQGKKKRYLLVALTLGLGLMAKPMLVTMPFVLLLLDYWPLGRAQSIPVSGSIKRPANKPTNSLRGIRILLSLVKEKLPFLALVVLSSVITFIAQKSAGAVQTVEELPLSVRIANALVAYTGYLEKMVCPSGLAAFYPHPGFSLPMWKAAASGAVILIVSYLVIREMRGRPYLAVGWFWYIGTLVPVIGIVQVGSQAMADRYTYIPLIGIFIMIAWGVPELLSRWKPRRIALAAAIGVVLVVLSYLTWTQVGYWRDGITLFGRAIEVVPENWLAYSNLGAALGQQGKTEEALTYQSEAIRIKPGYAEAHYNMAITLTSLGRKSEAINQYAETLRLKPDYVNARNNLGLLLAEAGRKEEAIAQYREALRVKPDYAEAMNNLGNALNSLERTEEAKAQFLQALRIRPDLWSANFNLAGLLAKQGKTAEAISHYTEALRIKPEHADAHNNLGQILAQQGKTAEARQQFMEALRINPDHPDAHYNLGKIYRDEGNTVEAINHYTEALRVRANFPDAQKDLATLLSGGSVARDAKAYYTLGASLSAQGKFTEAAAKYFEALRLNPNYAEAHNELGAALGRQGKLSEAVAHINEALRLKPDFADAHNNLGIALAMQGRTEDAVSQFLEALKLDPDNWSAHYNFGLVLSRQGKVAEAIAQLTEALRIKPDYTEAHRELDKLRALDNREKSPPEKP